MEFKLSNITWGRDIVDLYPDIYINGGNYGECNLRYGFEFQEGWRKIVEEFSAVADSLVTHLKYTGIQPDAFVRACIFKEKFGQLTWQGNDNLIYPFNELFRAYESKIENKSLHTCEVCGEWGKLQQNGWWAVRCKAHEQRNYLL